MRVGQLDIAGSTRVEPNASLQGAQINLKSDGSLAIHGDATIDSIGMQDGLLEVAPEGRLQVTGLLRQTGGTLRLAGKTELRSLQHTGGVIEVYNQETPIHISDVLRFGTRASVDFYLENEPWTATITLGEDVSPSIRTTLNLHVLPEADLAEMIGSTFKLFEWSTSLAEDNHFLGINFPPRTRWDTSQLYLTGEVTLEELLTHPLLPGDFNEDNQLNVDDVDALAAEIREPTDDTFFDVNVDMRVDHTDLDIWVHDLRQTWFGDANLDGEFNSDDLVSVLAAGEYEDDNVDNSGWADGDWDADAEFTSADLVVCTGRRRLRAGSTTSGGAGAVCVPRVSPGPWVVDVVPKTRRMATVILSAS